MPDPNKFKALQEAGYTIPVTCGLCVHGNFPVVGGLWGTCGAIKYNHLKHTGPQRDASIICYGTCPKAELLNGINIGAHQEFIVKKD